MKQDRFGRFAWGVVGANLAVILWGAVVRATGSGAGCANSWPTCDGEVVPLSGSSELFIEFVHRLTSGVALIGVGVLVVWAFRRYPAGHRARAWAVASVLLIVVEALLGAGLVVFDQVADNQEVSRGFWISAHFTNTTLLLGALTLTAWHGSGRPGVHPEADRTDRRLVAVGVVAILAVGVSGAIAALGDTLFPSASFFDGLRRESSATAHLFERLRVFHPLIAVGVAFFTVGIARRLGDRTAFAGLAGRAVIVGLGVQLAAGALNVALAAPLWLQLAHLLVADSVWIGFVVLAAEALSAPGAATAPLARTPGTAAGGRVAG